MRDAGRFIVLEGVDGSGKTTQVTLISGWLSALGHAHITAREPGGTAVGEAIRSIVLSKDDLEMPAESELLLILAARAAFVRDVVRPALAEGKTVIADRFSLSTLAYQGYGRGLDLDDVRKAIDFATGGLTPDLYIVLDVPIAEGKARQERARDESDRIERAGTAFREAVRNGYLALKKTDKHVAVIDGRGAPDEVHARIRATIEARFPSDFGVT